jgi:hypothetical protein
MNNPSISKRGISNLAINLASLGMLGVSSPGLSAPDADRSTKEEWMAAWMAVAPRDEQGALFLGRFKDPMYYLTKSISWIPNNDQVGHYARVDVPVGFVTDLASIPQIFWSLLKPDGEYAYSAIVHDYLYWTQTTTRETADQVLKLGMQDFSINSATIFAIYTAVRGGGQSAWDENTRLKAQGEKRILGTFPDDPRITWEQWKNRPGVFAP